MARSLTCNLLSNALTAKPQAILTAKRHAFSLAWITALHSCILHWREASKYGPTDQWRGCHPTKTCGFHQGDWELQAAGLVVSCTVALDTSLPLSSNHSTENTQTHRLSLFSIATKLLILKTIHIQHRNNTEHRQTCLLAYTQESHAIAKVTARCAL